MTEVDLAARVGQARLLLETVLEHSQDWISIIGPSGRTLDVNGFGRASMLPDDGTGYWVDGWPDETRVAAEAALAEAQGGSTARFIGYCPTRDGDPRWWDVTLAPVGDEEPADEDTGSIVVVSRDITLQFTEVIAERQARQRAELHAEQANIVSAEMRHRLKNLLAVISSIASISARNRRSVTDFLETFLKRLRAFGDSQDLLTRSIDRPMPLDEAIASLIDSNSAAEGVEIGDMPDGNLHSASLQILALVMNELVTNARKYGALSHVGGSIRIDCDEGDGRALICWKERWQGTPQPRRDPGTGHEMMSRMCRASGQTFETDWRADGVDVRFSVALDDSGAVRE